ncbi:Pyridoxal phosphate homeostasis protein [Streptomyces violaceorubidus]
MCAFSRNSGAPYVAENRDQDAAPKAAACSDLPLSWHFVGQLQTNKVRSVVGYADVVQSVDRAKLVTALSKEAVRTGREVGCLLQVALDAGEGAGSAAVSRPPESKSWPTWSPDRTGCGSTG